MKIIAGEAKNKTIKSRKGTDTRPTLGSMKESSILNYSSICS